MTRQALSFLLPAMLAASLLPGCETFTDMGLKGARWELYDIRIEGGDLNVMLFGLLDYQENNPAYRYEIEFFGDDRCTGTYYAADTIAQVDEGVWSLPRHDILRIKLGGIVNGEFDIAKLERHVFFLSTEKNYHGLSIEPPYFPMDMYIRRSY